MVLHSFSYINVVVMTILDEIMATLNVTVWVKASLVHITDFVKFISKLKV